MHMYNENPVHLYVLQHKAVTRATDRLVYMFMRESWSNTPTGTPEKSPKLAKTSSYHSPTAIVSAGSLYNPHLLGGRDDLSPCPGLPCSRKSVRREGHRGLQRFQRVRAEVLPESYHSHIIQQPATFEGLAQGFFFHGWTVRGSWSPTKLLTVPG